MGICFVGKRKKFSDFLTDYIEPKVGPVLVKYGTASDCVDHSAAVRKSMYNAWNGRLKPDQMNRLIGTHNGTPFYTIGQTYRLSGSKEKLFVCEKDHENNIIYVTGASKSNRYLNTKWFRTVGAHWLVPDVSSFIASETAPPLSTKIRHSEQTQPCGLQFDNNDPTKIIVDATNTDTVFSCVAPGQAAVFYAKDDTFEDLVCLGSGIIA